MMKGGHGRTNQLRDMTLTSLLDHASRAPHTINVTY